MSEMWLRSGCMAALVVSTTCRKLQSEGTLRSGVTSHTLVAATRKSEPGWSARYGKKRVRMLRA